MSPKQAQSSPSPTSLSPCGSHARGFLSQLLIAKLELLFIVFTCRFLLCCSSPPDPTPQFLRDFPCLAMGLRQLRKEINKRPLGSLPLLLRLCC